MRTKTLMLLWVATILALHPACKSQGNDADAAAAEQAALYRSENTPENLRGLLESILAAAHAGNTHRAAALSRTLLPDSRALAAALRADAPPGIRATLQALYRPLMTGPDRALATRYVATQDHSVVRVHAATAEALAAGTVAKDVLDAFPEGARRVARTLLRPDQTFYVVEMVEPGKPSGTKFHLFFWDGAQWRSLGPIWRAL